MWVNGAQRTFRAMKLLCMILLDWPKICSTFSITAYGENLNKLTGQPITMVEAYYKFVQIHRMYTTKSEHSANYGLRVIIMGQRRFISCHKCSALVRMMG